MRRITLHCLILLVGGQFVATSAQADDGEIDISASTSLPEPITTSSSYLEPSSSLPIPPTADPITTDPTDPTGSLQEEPPTSTTCTCILETSLFPTVPCSGKTSYVAGQVPKPTYRTVTQTVTVDYNATTAPPTLITPMPPCSTFACPNDQCFTRPMMPGDDVIEITQKTTMRGPAPTETPPSFDEKPDDPDDSEGSNNSEDSNDTDDKDDSNDNNADDGKSNENNNGDGDGDGDGDSDSDKGDDEDPGSESYPYGVAGVGTSTEESDHSTDKSSDETEAPGSSDPTITSPPSTDDNDAPDGASPATTIVTLNGVPVTIIDHAKSIIIGNTGSDRITITESSISTTFSADGQEWTVNPSEIICSGSTMMLETDTTGTSTPTASGDGGTITATATTSPSDSSDGRDSSGDENEGEESSNSGDSADSGDSGSSPNLAATIMGSDLKVSLAFGTITACIFGGIFGFL